MIAPKISVVYIIHANKKHLPANKNTLFSLAISEYALVDVPGIGSAYSGK